MRKLAVMLVQATAYTSAPASLTSGSRYDECWELLLTYRDHVQGRAIVLTAQMASKYNNRRGTMHMGPPPMHQEETLPGRCLLEVVPILRTKDIPTTLLRATIAGLWGLIIHLIAVIVREFLTCPNIPDRHNPDDTPELFGLAVWVTRMVDIACRVLACTPINSIALIQAKDIGIACG